MTYEPTLVPKTDVAPVERVEITFSTVAPTTQTATVYRIAAGRTFRVRGGVNIVAAGGFSLVDTEAPFRLSMDYRAEMFDSGGVSLGFTDPATTYLDVDLTRIHQPTDPTRNVVGDFMAGTAAQLVRPFRGQLVEPLHRTLPVFIGSGRTGLRGVPVIFRTNTFQAALDFDGVFGLYDDDQIPVVCIRSSLFTGLPQPFFALIQEPTRTESDVKPDGSIVDWLATADEVSPPVEAIVTAILTYADLEVFYVASYSSLEAAYVTYLPMESDYSIAGTA